MYLVMNEAKAEELESLTEGREHRLDPRLIEGGENAGRYALPIAVKYDPAFVDLMGHLGYLFMVELDPAEAFPEGEDGN